MNNVWTAPFPLLVPLPLKKLFLPQPASVGASHPVPTLCVHAWTGVTTLTILLAPAISMAELHFLQAASLACPPLQTPVGRFCVHARH